MSILRTILSLFAASIAYDQITQSREDYARRKSQAIDDEIRYQEHREFMREQERKQHEREIAEWSRQSNEWAEDYFKFKG